MARITLGPMVTDIAGSIGGITFQRNGSGRIARLKPVKTVNPTPKQVEQHTHVAQLVNLWQFVTPAQRVNWQWAADNQTHFDQWGREKTLTAFQWFMAANLARYTLGEPYEPATFTPIPVPAPVDQFTLEATVDHLKILWPAPIVPPAENLSIFATPPVRRASLKWSRSLRLIRVWRQTPVTELNITSWYEETFNLSWSNIFASGAFFVTIRGKSLFDDSGVYSNFTSAQARIS